ncbi:hypothetical protein HanRHA438_Chr02g0054421 [Helianthus annuus]|nr:hypothetical protein HanRHA438_Chr02g0054421 [Helianthus annuus]
MMFHYWFGGLAGCGPEPQWLSFTDYTRVFTIIDVPSSRCCSVWVSMLAVGSTSTACPVSSFGPMVWFSISYNIMEEN